MVMCTRLRWFTKRESACSEMPDEAASEMIATRFLSLKNSSFSRLFTCAIGTDFEPSCRSVLRVRTSIFPFSHTRRILRPVSSATLLTPPSLIIISSSGFSGSSITDILSSKTSLSLASRSHSERMAGSSRESSSSAAARARGARTTTAPPASADDASKSAPTRLAQSASMRSRRLLGMLARGTPHETRRARSSSRERLAILLKASESAVTSPSFFTGMRPAPGWEPMACVHMSFRIGS
mmetsp:Transcript_4119/g.10488  ORF Transcript_4119/g.10488 Transcript_4119/m.10488 type:complete len:239 (-) Transcript_4119:18-734(-)